MASYFGEILPVISRAVDDDDDEEESVLNEQKIKFEWTSNQPVKQVQCKQLVIAVGNTASAFVEVYMLDNSAANQMTLTMQSDVELDDSGYQKPQKLHFPLHQINDLAVIVCKESLPAEYTFAFVEKLFEQVKLESGGSVCTLCSAPVNDYKCGSAVSGLNIPFLRALCTSTYKSQPVCPYLEQPNTVSSLPAQVMSHCEVHQIKAVLYQTFTETVYLDADSIKSFKKAVGTLSLNQKLQESVETKQRIVKLTSSHAQKNLLYL